MKRVLVIAYYFPPSGGPGVQRALKFVKYLPDFGWHPVVLTVRRGVFFARDETLLSEIPQGTEVFRAPSLEPAGSRLIRMLAGRQKNRSASAPKRVSSRVRLLRRLRAWLLVPDEKVGWIPFAVSYGRRILRTQRLQAIVSSSPPCSSHLVALKLSSAFSVPWIADFRDPWTDNHLFKEPSPFHRALNRCLERRVVSRADRVITISETIRSHMVLKYHSAAGKILVIPNGYDPRDFQGLTPFRKDPSRFTITYAGTFYERIGPEFFLKGLRRALDEQRGLGSAAKVRFIGQMDQEQAVRVHRIIRALGLEDVVEIAGYVSHRECLAAMLGADLLLLVLPPDDVNRGTLTTKLFEYLGAGRPILALCGEGEASRLIRKLGCGSVVLGTDVEGIKRAIIERFNAFKRGEPGPTADPSTLRPFQRRNQAEALAGCLDQLYQGS